MRRLTAALAVIALQACGAPIGAPIDQTLSAEDVRSGYVFLTPESQALQDDPFENPGFLWVERGETLFQSGSETSPSCISCHETGLNGVAANYPAFDQTLGQLLNLEGRINACRTEHQNLDALAYESEDLLSLTTYVANQSFGQPVSVDTSGPSLAYYEQGEAYFQTRRGQFNLSCQQCHTETWGKQLRGDTISQGHGNGFPAYRFEWQTLGSLQRRLRDCDTGVRAEPLPYGDPIYVALELYLAVRAEGLSVETPAVRR